MHPKLKSDTFFIPIENGVYLRNNEHAFVIKGRTLATWMERLAPLLDGNHELEQLCRGLSPEKRKTCLTLIQALAEHGYIRDTSDDYSHTLTAQVQETYASAITFLEYHRSSAPYHFQQFRDMRVLAIGSGDGLIALAHALLETGNRRIHLLDTGEEETDRERLTTLLSLLQNEQDAELTLTSASHTAWENDATLSETLASFEMVLFFSSTRASDPPAQINRLAKLCYSLHIAFIPAMFTAKQAMIGPAQRPDEQGCWQCYWRRFRAAHGLSIQCEDEALLHFESATNPPLSRYTANALVANMLALEFFKQGTGISVDTLHQRVMLLELERFTSATHRVYPHPLCSICLPPAPDPSLAIERLRHLHDEDQQDFLKLTEQLSDGECGIFTHIEEWNFYQLPLLRCQITVAAPTEGRLPVVSGPGLDYQQARRLGVERALIYYLERLEDRRSIRFCSYEDYASQEPVLPPQSFWGWCGRDLPAKHTLAWTSAWDLANNCLLPVPAASVYPQSSWNNLDGSLLFSRDTPAIAIGATWEETLARALCSLKHASLIHSDTKITKIAASTYTGDESCAAYLKMLDIMSYEVELLTMTEEAGLPYVAVALNRQCVSAAAHWSTLSAIREALQNAVLFAQQRQAGEQPADDPEIRTLQNRFSALQACSAMVSLPASLAEETDYHTAADVLQRQFKQQGWHAFVVPLMMDTTVASIAKCALRVLMARPYSEDANRATEAQSCL